MYLLKLFKIHLVLYYMCSQPKLYVALFNQAILRVVFDVYFTELKNLIVILVMVVYQFKYNMLLHKNVKYQRLFSVSPCIVTNVMV